MFVTAGGITPTGGEAPATGTFVSIRYPSLVPTATAQGDISIHSTELDTVQKCKYSLIWSLHLWNGYSLWEMTLYPTQMKLLENKTIYNLVLNCVVVFTITARGDLRKKRSKQASGAVDFMVGLQLGFIKNG